MTENIFSTRRLTKSIIFSKIGAYHLDVIGGIYGQEY